MAIDRSRTQLARLTSTSRPTALVDPIRAFARADVRDRALWLRPTTGEALVGIGCAASLSSGAEWRQLLADAAIDGPVAPVLIGGFAFDPSEPPSALWHGFPAKRMVLPERLLRIGRDTAWLTTIRVSNPPPRQLASEQQTRPRTGLDAAAWRALVAEVASGIRGGDLGVRKVVLARAEQIEVEVSLETALRRLADAYPACTVFAIASGDACFLGATPERLVGLHDGIATTMALAGSGPRGRNAEEDAELAKQLLRDPKERTEHAVVVDALREDLAPVSARVMAEAEPRIHALANLHHLVTPIRARVKAGNSVLDLVARLHPTPAVGGYPRQRALEVIREREGLDRGWYAAPLGWVDAHGDGQFVVGLRSGLLRDRTATLFAGCGIVGHSDPEREYAEAGWKLQPMLNALGANV